MKKLLVMLLVMAGAYLAGCTVTETPAERCRRYSDITCIQAREGVEDLDYFLLYERPSYLTPWHIRSGLPD